MFLDSWVSKRMREKERYDMAKDPKQDIAFAVWCVKNKRQATDKTAKADFEKSLRGDVPDGRKGNGKKVRKQIRATFYDAHGSLLTSVSCANVASHRLNALVSAMVAHGTDAIARATYSDVLSESVMEDGSIVLAGKVLYSYDPRSEEAPAVEEDSEDLSDEDLAAA